MSELKIPKKQQEILINLRKTVQELENRFQTAVNVIIAGLDANEKAKYALSEDCSSFVVIEDKETTEE